MLRKDVLCNLGMEKVAFLYRTEPQGTNVVETIGKRILCDGSEVSRRRKDENSSGH